MSFVYFVGAEQLNLVKIGFTTNDPRSRLSAMQVGSPDRLELLGYLPGTYYDEQAYHAKYARDRSHGEWFRRSAALEDDIAEAAIHAGTELQVFAEERGARVIPTWTPPDNWDTTDAYASRYIREPFDWDSWREKYPLAT